MGDKDAVFHTLLKFYQYLVEKKPAEGYSQVFDSFRDIILFGRAGGVADEFKQQAGDRKFFGGVNYCGTFHITEVGESSCHASLVQSFDGPVPGGKDGFWEVRKSLGVVNMVFSTYQVWSIWLKHRSYVVNAAQRLRSFQCSGRAEIKDAIWLKRKTGAGCGHCGVGFANPRDKKNNIFTNIGRAGTVSLLLQSQRNNKRLGFKQCGHDDDG